ncbi:MAG: glycosyltransferase family 4 protein [Candidatus Bathyarchaeia archaeon]
MKVLVVAPNYPSPEDKHAFGFVHSRAKIYSEKGLSVQVYIPSNTSASQTYTYENIKVSKGNHSLLRKIIKEFDPDVIAVHAPNPSTLTYINKFQKPTIVWIHGAEVLIRPFHHYMASFGIRNQIQKVYSLFYDATRNLTLRKAIKKADAVIYVSKWLQKVAEKYLMMRHPKTFIIPNPVNTKLFKPNKANDVTKMDAGVSVRALEWKYGLDIAIKAFAHSKISLTIVGKGSLETYLKSLAKKINANVKFITEGIEHNKLPNFYNKFAFFIAPSRTEAQGVAMCEAMACGLPVVATEVGGIPEFVVNEYSGLLVPPENPKALKQAIMKLTSNNTLYNSLSQNARKYVVNNLSHELIFNRELKIFKMVVNKAKR